MRRDSEKSGGRRDFVAVVDHTIALLGQRGRVAYRTLTVPCTLDDDALETLKDALLYAPQIAWEKEGRVVGWTASVQPPPSPPPRSPTPASQPRPQELPCPRRHHPWRLFSPRRRPS